MADKEIKLEFSKTEDGRILLVLSSVYQHNCSDQKTVIVRQSSAYKYHFTFFRSEVDKCTAMM